MLDYTDEQNMIREMVSKVAREKIEPLIEELDEKGEGGGEAIDILRDASKQGWTLNYPVCFMTGYEGFSSMMELQTKMFWPHEDTNLDDKRKVDNIKVKACENCRYRLVCIGVMKNYIDVMGESEIKAVKGKLVKNAKEVY